MRRFALCTLVALLSVSVLAGDALAAKKTPIRITNCDYLANTPGRTYYIDANLQCPTNHQWAIKITAPDITLDLKGFTITGTDDGTPSLRSGIIIETAGTSSTTIRNGTVTRFEHDGVFNNSGGQVVISDMAAVGNGLVSGSGSGFRLHGSGAKVTDSVASGNLGDGFDVISFDDPVTFTRTTSTRNAGYGFEVYGASPATFTDVTAAGNANDGIEVTGDGTVIKKSEVASNGNADPESGITIHGNDAKIDDTVATGNFFHGIHIDDGIDAEINKVRADANGWGVPDQAGIGIYDDSLTATSSPEYNNIAHANDTDSFQNQCQPSLFFCLTDWRNDGDEDDAIPVSSCGTTLDQANRVYVLTTNLACPGNGLDITADNVTLDLSAKHLTNTSPPGSGNAIFVAPTGVHDVTIRDGVIRDFRDGIASSAGNEIEDVTISKVFLVNNDDNGVVMHNAVTFRESVATRNGETGVTGLGAGSEVLDSWVTGNGGNGVRLGSDALVKKSSILVNGDGGTDVGLLIEGDKPKIQKSKASGNWEQGIKTIAMTESGATVTKNETLGNGWGVIDNSGTGIWVVDGVAKGKNWSFGNDSSVQCDPGNLC